MFETLDLADTTAKEASVFFGLGIGLLFGILAQLTAFCFRRAMVGDDRRQAGGVWAMALCTAILGTQSAVWMGWITFEGHRLMTPDLPVLAIGLGGLLFGFGMVLTRGCTSRLLVLSGGGNLRAALVLVLFTIVAHATLKGVLAPLRVSVGSVTVPLADHVSLASLPGGAIVWSAVVALVALFIALRSGNRVVALLGGAMIGLLVPLAWVGTGYVLLDEFDPITMESLSLTSSGAESLFYLIASSAVPAGFGPALLLGILIGAFVASVLRGRFMWQSFESPAQTLRYLLGAVFMGLGGVLAGGCTLGAGLSGIPTLSLAACFALLSIAVGAKLAKPLA